MFFHRKNGEGIDLSKLNRNTEERKINNSFVLRADFGSFDRINNNNDDDIVINRICIVLILYYTVYDNLDGTLVNRDFIGN